ncbi:MAG: hypothetical protein HY290_33820 [Planctomycetia bacterium]|nr:hypothetical protein [Planctomycetia bacterium]
MSPRYGGTRTAAGSARILCGLLCLVIALDEMRGRAQEPSAGEQPVAVPRDTPAAKGGSPKSAGKSPSTKSGEGSDGTQFDIIYLPGPGGVLVPVRAGASLEGYYRYLDQQESPEGPPLAAVYSLQFDGAVVDDRVQLVARVEVIVTAESGWQEVKLFMQEATLRDVPAHEGPGPAVPGPLLPDFGYTWWIKGKGTHTLTLPLSIPILKLATLNRIQATLPSTAARSKLTLRINSPRVLPKVPESSTLKSKSVPQGTELEVIGLGNRLDLTWQVLPDTQPAETALEVTTYAVATLVDGESVTLEATQRIQSLGQQGTFEEVRVSLPPGYELLRLDGREHRDHRPDPGNPQQIVVQLKKPTSGPVDLKWTVRSKLPAVGESFALQGFEVDRARLQTGFLAVVVVGDFRYVTETDKFLRRIDVANLPGPMQQVAAREAYQFLNRLHLRLKLQRIEPHVTVDPALLLHFSSDSAEIDGAFRLQVLRGSITSFRLRWPGWKQQGWTMTHADLPGQVEFRQSEVDGDADVIKLDFLEPAKGTVDVRFRARRALDSAGGPVSLTLPAPETPHPYSTRLAVVSADNVEVELRPSETTVLYPLSEPSARIQSPREWQSLRRSDYRLESPRSELAVGLSVHSRQLHATSEVEASIRSGAVTVRQKMLFDVSYERIAQLRFSVPEGVAPEQLKFFASGDRKLPALFVPGSGRAPAEMRVSLDSPVIGRFEIDARYALPGIQPSSGSQTTKVSIPFMQSNDVPFSETRLTCRDAAGREATVDGSGWQLRLAAEGLPVWTIGSGPASAELTVAHSAGALHVTQVTKTLIRTVVTAGGIIENRAQYRLSEGVSELSIAFPAGLEPTGFWWNRGELAVGSPADAADGTRLFEIVIPDRTSSADRLLTITFRTHARHAGRFGADYALRAPQLPHDLRTSQVYWQVELPYQEHLFTEPTGYAAEYRWEFGKLLWAREPDLSDLELQQWIGTAAGPALQSVRPGENRYLFATSGEVPPLSFRALRKWSMTLFGAGIALALGLVVLRWPTARNPAALLLVVFIVALLGAWHSGPVLVLLQPALLGVLLALLAAFIKSFQQRRSRPVLLALGSASGFAAAPASSHPRSPSIGVGSNDYTSLRPPPDASRTPAPVSGQVSGQLSESGSRL